MGAGETHTRMTLVNIQHQRREDQVRKGPDDRLHHCDCVLVCQDGHLVCHSAMLAAASSLWTSLLSTVQTQLGLEHLVILLILASFGSSSLPGFSLDGAILLVAILRQIGLLRGS